MNTLQGRTRAWVIALLAGAAVTIGCDGSDGGGTGGGHGGGATTTGTGGLGGAGGATGAGGAPPGQCRAQEDCAEEGSTCFAPGTIPLCGVCMVPDVPCGDDAICHQMAGPTSICGNTGCLCEPGCVEGCTADSQCSIGQECAPDHHCVPRECAAAGDCPTNFDCMSGACSRRTCATDGDGCAPYCVLGLCYGALGTCAYPPP